MSLLPTEKKRALHPSNLCCYMRSCLPSPVPASQLHSLSRQRVCCAPCSPTHPPLPIRPFPMRRPSALLLSPPNLLVHLRALQGEASLPCRGVPKTTPRASGKAKGIVPRPSSIMWAGKNQGSGTGRRRRRRATTPSGMRAPMMLPSIRLPRLVPASALAVRPAGRAV